MKKFLKNHLRTIILGIIISLAVVHFIVNFELVQNTKLIEQSWANLINGYILIITMSAGLILLMWLTFLMSKGAAKDTERFLLKNLTTACFLLIFLLILQGKTFGLDGQSILTAMGAIIVFWYGYKTYERDKELDLIKSYSERYNIELKNAKEHEYKGILDVWYEEYFLYRKGYISEELWKEWDFWNTEDISSFLSEDSDDLSIENDEDGWSIGKFLSFSLTYLRNRENSIGYDYGKYLCEKIDTYLETQSDDSIDSTSFYTKNYKTQLKKHFNRVRSFFKIHKKYFYN